MIAIKVVFDFGFWSLLKLRADLGLFLFCQQVHGI